MIPRRRLLAELRAAAEELGRAPSTAEYDALGDHSSDTVARRFGSWRAGLRAAGVGPRDPWRDEGWLRERADAGMSAREIADEAGCHPGTVAMWAGIHGIEGSGPGPTRGPARRLLEMDPDEVTRR